MSFWVDAGRRLMVALWFQMRVLVEMSVTYPESFPRRYRLLAAPLRALARAGLGAAVRMMGLALLVWLAASVEVAPREVTAVRLSAVARASVVREGM